MVLDKVLKRAAASSESLKLLLRLTLYIFNVSLLLRVWVLRRFKEIQLSIISLLYSVVGKLWFITSAFKQNNEGQIKNFIEFSVLVANEEFSINFERVFLELEDFFLTTY
jgi:hypothetical protein